MKFDCYSATFPVRPDLLVEGILSGFPDAGLRVERGKSALRYAAADLLFDPMDQMVCGVHHGGQNGNPHVRVQGWYSPKVVGVVRGLWPDHSVSRADVALDFDSPGCWDRIAAVCDLVAREGKLKWSTVGDFREDRDVLSGRTIYVGSRQSPVYIRVYEKGKQMLAQHRVGDAAISLDWVRVEIEVKPPHRPFKLAAASWEPPAFWGCSVHSRKLLHRVSGVEVERIMMTERKETDARRAVRNMLKQYRGSMEAVIVEVGGDAAFMRFARSIWAELDDVYGKESVPEDVGVLGPSSEESLRDFARRVVAGSAA